MFQTIKLEILKKLKIEVTFWLSHFFCVSLHGIKKKYFMKEILESLPLGEDVKIAVVVVLLLIITLGVVSKKHITRFLTRK